MKGIRRSELEPCAFCGKGLLHAGRPMAYRVTVEAHVFDVGAINQHAGMDMMFGNQAPALSLALIGDSELTKQATSVTKLVCYDCALLGGHLDARLMEDTERAT